MSSPYKFALISHSIFIIEDVKNIAPQDWYTLNCQVTLHEDLIAAARSRLAEGYEVLLCHGGTGNSIVKHIGHSAVAIDRTDTDVIHALREARQHSESIVIALFEEEYHDIALMEELLNIRLHCLVYRTWEEMFQKIEQAYAEGWRVLVGGGVSSQKMIQLGGTGIVIRANPHSVQKALDQAVLIARQKRLEAARHADLVSVLKYIPQGVLCVDTAGALVFANSKALELLHISGNATQKELAPFYADLLLAEVLEGGVPAHNSIREVQGESFVVNAFPLSFQSDHTGAVSIFHDVPSLQHINRTITDKLYANGFVSAHSLATIKGTSACIVALRDLVRRFAKVNAIVLISGETGTGKELVAHALHAEGPRKKAPFVAINCGALPESLIESELFGYADGAFTGAKKGGKTGLFEMAAGGTIFLDEIAEISPAMQLRLLRVLETRQIMRIGASRIITVDVRIVCASHKNLLELVQAGQFRQDLYYRLSTLLVRVPPLRERLEDIPLLIAHAAQHSPCARLELTPDMLRQMQSYQWPGNIRELLAFLEKFGVMKNNNALDATLFTQLLHEHIHAADFFLPRPELLHAQTTETRLSAARAALAQFHNNKKAAAEYLGISTSTLWRVLRRGQGK